MTAGLQYGIALKVGLTFESGTGGAVEESRSVSALILHTTRIATNSENE